MSATLKEKFHAMLDGLAKIVRPRRDTSNAGPFLYDIWFYQEMEAFACDRGKIAWKKAQDGGIIPDDDEMRKKTGETIIVDSDRFSCVATVASPAERFDKELFITNLVKTLKLDRAKVEAIAERSKKKNKAQLTKRVIEA
jgi:hypothetical protein